MHPNPVFHTADSTRNLAFARERAFGVLSVNGTDAPLVSHVPFLLADNGKSLDLHLVRSNPIARALKSPLEAVMAISGPDSYVSPDWYGIDDQVPTWNYIAVHLRGSLSALSSEEMRDMLDRQSALFEERLLPKTPWKTDKMPADLLDKLMRSIVPCRMQIESVDGTWKLSQNKTDLAREHAADHVDSYGFGADHRLLAALMRSA